MKMDSKSGATLAAAAATLFLAGATVSTVSTSAHAAGMGQCFGANACKGQSACKSAANSCKGLNACKGLGFSKTSEKSCANIGGKFVKS